MKVKQILVLGWFMILSLALQAQVKIHSHNDYTHQNPFFEAINQKAFSIEADIFLVGDSLMVAHSKKEIKTGNTLEKMYLKPIEALSKTKNFYSFQLMIDVKDNWNLTYPVLLKTLNRYKRDFKKQGKKVSVVISGSRPAESTFHHYPNVINFDGLPGQDYAPKDLKKVVMISDNLATYSKWNGIGKIPDLDKEKLLKVINNVHKIGKPCRFWNAPDTEACWNLLRELRADIINTDKVKESTAYFKN